MLRQETIQLVNMARQIDRTCDLLSLRLWTLDQVDSIDVRSRSVESRPDRVLRSIFGADEEDVANGSDSSPREIASQRSSPQDRR